MKRPLIQWLGLSGLLALLSYTAAVVISPSAYPGYDWMAQAVSDLSAQSAPSRMLWQQLAAFYDIGSVVSATCVSIYISETKAGSRLFRLGMHLFTIMMWVSAVGYQMFPLADGGKEIASFAEVMHIAVTAAVVLLSIVSLVILMLAAVKKHELRPVGIAAAIALGMMLVGAVGQGLVPSRYFGIVERFSVFAAVGFNAVNGLYMFTGFAGLPQLKSYEK